MSASFPQSALGPSTLRQLGVRRRVADKLAARLAREGVEVVFGIPGGAISPLNDALIDIKSIRTVITRHETEAVFAACGHALVSGKPGVVFVTSGPGLTNALTGLAAAKCDRVPVVILAGEVPRPLQGKGALQDGSAHNLNMLAVARSLAKAVFEVAEPKTAALRIADALRTAGEGVPGPVVVTLPLDVMMAEVPVSEECFARAQPGWAFDDVVLDDIHARLLDEPRPLLFAGSGLRSGDGPAALRAFAERYRIPVMTTPKAKGVFPEDHELSLGVFGIGGHPSALRYVQEGVGTLLACGTGLGDLATEGFRDELKPARALVHVDVNPAVIGRHYETQIGVVGPAAPFLRALCTREIVEAPIRPVARFGVVTHADPEVQREGTENLIAPSRAVAELQRSLPEDTLYIIDSGEHFLFAVHYLKLNRPDQFIALTGLGSMGSSLGLAVGAKLANPSRPVCVIIGDGGMTMSGLELLDAVAHRLDIVVAVMNDARLGMCEVGHKGVYGRTPDLGVPHLEIPSFAASIGARGHVCFHAGDVEHLGPVLAGAGRPTLLDIRIDRSIAMPKRDRIKEMEQRSRIKAA